MIYESRSPWTRRFFCTAEVWIARSAGGGQRQEVVADGQGRRVEGRTLSPKNAQVAAAKQATTNGSVEEGVVETGSYEVIGGK